MRRLFIPLAALTLFLTITLAASLFSIIWITPGSAHRLTLQGGSAGIWIGSPGDWSGFVRPYGLEITGWTGNQWRWQPTLDTKARLFVQTAPAPAGVAVVNAKRISGIRASCPVYLLLLPVAAGTALTFPAWKRHRFAARGRCRDCGYDLTGLTGRCPECGNAIRRLIALILRARCSRA